jgi:hypothetical protein
VLLRANNTRQPYHWLVRISFVGQFANNFLPTSVGGDALHLLAPGQRSGNYARASVSVFMERLFGGATTGPARAANAEATDAEADIAPGEAKALAAPALRPNEHKPLE